MKQVQWSVYLERFDRYGEPLSPLRMRCASEEDARREFAKHGAVAIGREEIWYKVEDGK